MTEFQINGRRTASGVFIASDFRDNLIIDRYDPLFVGMRGSKRTHMQSANSEDAITWNVFRSLRQLSPELWLAQLTQRGLGVGLGATPGELALDTWVPVSPPHGITRFQSDEGETEADVIIETPDWVWFIEAKYKSDISLRTTSNERRDQVLRNLDVGSYYAGIRDFYFSLLVRERGSSEGISRLAQYSQPEFDFRELLPHRPDGLRNLKGTGVLTWADTALVLEGARSGTKRVEEVGYAERALHWLRTRSIESPAQNAG